MILILKKRLLRNFRFFDKLGLKRIKKYVPDSKGFAIDKTVLDINKNHMNVVPNNKFKNRSMNYGTGRQNVASLSLDRCKW